MVLQHSVGFQCAETIGDLHMDHFSLYRGYSPCLDTPKVLHFGSFSSSFCSRCVFLLISVTFHCHAVVQPHIFHLNSTRMSHVYQLFCNTGMQQQHPTGHQLQPWHTCQLQVEAPRHPSHYTDQRAAIQNRLKAIDVPDSRSTR